MTQNPASLNISATGSSKEIIYLNRFFYFFIFFIDDSDRANTSRISSFKEIGI